MSFTFFKLMPALVLNYDLSGTSNGTSKRPAISIYVLMFYTNSNRDTTTSSDTVVTDGNDDDFQEMVPGSGNVMIQDNIIK